MLGFRVVKRNASFHDLYDKHQRARAGIRCQGVTMGYGVLERCICNAVSSWRCMASMPCPLSNNAISQTRRSAGPGINKPCLFICTYIHTLYKGKWAVFQIALVVKEGCCAWRLKRFRRVGVCPCAHVSRLVRLGQAFDPEGREKRGERSERGEEGEGGGGGGGGGGVPSDARLDLFCIDPRPGPLRSPTCLAALPCSSPSSLPRSPPPPPSLLASHNTAQLS
ncbi:hypothetical protein K504DRAFT_55630 [Pleomassaria siparia CBS 279.74]|uniref:Uncharacterized protein n=1 Tax=Pleomassaria siparia CBS 279.74 TaxID=1314801 RepID=A0A6G1K3C8_9PLEO|nr:hypothetical protein K504DRAFT_55630 [Pleomassaria siparia CBS 279.74]